MKKIKNIANELEKGASFEDMVMTYSEDIASKDIGGDLEYFDADIYSEKFGIALESMRVNDISNIIELEDSYHILKMTEFNKTEIMSMEAMQENFINELVASESLALMNDDYDLIDEMIFSNNSIESISGSVSRSLNSFIGKQSTNFNIEIDDERIRDIIFSPDSEIDVPIALNIDDSIIVLSLSSVIEPSLQKYENVKDDVDNLLTNFKIVEKRNLLISELALAKADNTIQSFLKAYDFISEDSFIEVKKVFISFT